MSIRDSTKTLLRSVGYEVAAFESAEVYLGSGAIAETECLVLDICMPGMDGLELQRRLNGTNSRAPIIFITGYDDGTSRRQAIEAGAVAVLRKPFEEGALVAAVQKALMRHNSAADRTHDASN